MDDVLGLIHKVEWWTAPLQQQCLGSVGSKVNLTLDSGVTGGLKQPFLCVT